LIWLITIIDYNLKPGRSRPGVSEPTGIASTER
jgi:hypothetical protein